jgi:propanol-preferring alcohol dehydrogenase
MQLKTIEGSNVSTMADFRELVDLARAGRVPHIPVTVRPAREATAVLEDLRAGRVVGRAVLAHD